MAPNPRATDCRTRSELARLLNLYILVHFFVPKKKKKCFRTAAVGSGWSVIPP